ncbi:MAG: hypothetical protein A2527_11450 [Candidatus Lambdaproteobacteria bacterium RIFOXYD2_FULL_50_16]|uniref:Uncharacterized protein n=1 Tax=Candidatus Lambdaproteobacteria bacterium RIFOXYD2_FULL_50_16 TaxID=1817772 RepID=A0A1F6G6J8_9PROT|nr:MAG: hypothetical protein A2527_11450 [Candidatus Lambdaproteobacteria bacterium RIFOXYD2_FULL_50_16]
MLRSFFLIPNSGLGRLPKAALCDFLDILEPTQEPFDFKLPLQNQARGRLKRDYGLGRASYLGSRKLNFGRSADLVST